MEPPSPSSQIIDISVDVPGGVPTIRASKVCTGSTCGFSETRSSPKDVKERSTSMQKLLIAVILCVIFMTVEVVGGIKANSLAILTDAAHLLSDVAAFAISLFSLWASGWEATPQQSYGFFRIEILGALVSIQIIWLLTGILVYEAIVRLIHDNGEVQGVLMFIVAAFGLVVNVVMAVLLGHDHGHAGLSHDHGHAGHSHDDGHGEHDHDHDHSDDEHSHNHDEHSDHFNPHGNDHHHDEHSHAQQQHGHAVSVYTPHHHQANYTKEGVVEPLLKHSKEAPIGNSTAKETKRKPRNINVHSAYLHVIGDSIQSVGVMIGGAIIWWKPEWKIIDLICTLIFSIIVLVTTIKMLRNILEVLMESTPREINATKLERGLCALDGVVAVHELHVWAITVGKVLLACHVTITPDANSDLVLDTVVSYIKNEYNISHITIQIERL